MRRRFLVILGIVIATSMFAGVVLAQFADTRTASGSVNATSASPDLYLCEPRLTSGPDCGSDDNGADETIFESLENIRPGSIVVQDLRLKNIGSQTWTVSSVNLSISESDDPGNDCADGALFHLPVPSANDNPDAQVGVQIFGKVNDPLNDNTRFDLFPLFLHRLVPGEEERNIHVVPGDYEDVRLLLQLAGTLAEGCSANEWQVSYEFSVLPTN